MVATSGYFNFNLILNLKISLLVIKAVFQMLDVHMWLVTAILDTADIEHFCHFRKLW